MPAPQRKDMVLSRRRTASLIAVLWLGLTDGSPSGMAGQTGLGSASKDANALAERCPSAADIASINRDLRLSFESDPTRGTLVCSAAEGSANLTLMQAQVYISLLAMRQLSFDAPLPWTKEPLYRWMTKTIGGIRFRRDIENSFCCDPPDTINLRDVTIGPPSVRGGAPTDFRQIESFLGLVVHESRHRNGKPHSCGNKDKTLKELGAWAAHYYFHVWVADHTAPDFMPPFMRDAIRTTAGRLCQEQFCEDRCAGMLEDMEYAVISAAAAQIVLPIGPVRLLLVSDRTVSFSCESGAETGLVIGDCNGMRAARQTPQQMLAAIRKGAPAVSKEMAASFLLGASKSVRIERYLNIRVQQVLWGPTSGRPQPKEPFPPDFAIYPSRVGFNPSRDVALLYLGVKALSGQSASFGEYILLTRTNNQWTVKGRARMWEIDPLKERN